MLRPIGWIIVGLAVIAAPAWAQTSPEAINADNILRLESVARIDFDALPASVGTVDLGWFALAQTGALLAVRNRHNDLVVLDAEGNVLDQYTVPGRDGLPATVLDADFDAAGDVLASAHLDGMGYDVAYRHIDTGTIEYFRFETQDAPLRIWMDQEVWLEISPGDSLAGRYVLQLLPSVIEQYRSGDTVNADELPSVLSGPENDPDAFLRIGRIKPPMAVTVTRDGLVKRWNLETGEATATAEVDSQPGVGQFNASGRYFVWRDAESANLFLLDFETGENRLVAPLDGTYVPLLFLSPEADVAIGVNVGLEPIIVAWNTQTGERYDLVEYRVCNRQPDMVRLSRDGTTLVVGCDTGLDIWRVEGD